MTRFCCLLILYASSLCAQTVMVCGLPKGCTLSTLDSSLTYDATSNKLKATPANTASILSKLSVDTFVVNCETQTGSQIGCPNGVPQTVFRTSKPTASILLVFRAFSQSLTGDYNLTPNPDGTVTVTFNVPLDTGNVVVFYLAQ